MGVILRAGTWEGPVRGKDVKHEELDVEEVEEADE